MTIATTLRAVLVGLAGALIGLSAVAATAPIRSDAVQPYIVVLKPLAVKGLPLLGASKPSPQVLPWGIDRIEADRSSTQAGDGRGSVAGVRAYIIDTGIASHADLNVVAQVNFAGGLNTDCHGHGTHVAGTVGARDNAQDVVGVEGHGARACVGQQRRGAVAALAGGELLSRGG